MMRLTIFLISILASLTVSAQRTDQLSKLISDKPAPEDFIIFNSGSAADILVDPKDNVTVLLVAGLFADDIERVSGQRASVINSAKLAGDNCIIIGTLNESRFIRKLIATDKIDVSRLADRWESCLIEVVENPIPGVAKALVIAGSDRRGTAYGVLELSKQMGVSPWYYFADVPVLHKDKLAVKAGRYIQESPSVKYRGIFINDEMWGIRPWAMNTLAPEEGKGLGPTTYSKVFELLLRLRANTLWPAMHQQTRPFNYYDRNRVVANEYGIVMGSSHIEPMLRNNIAGAEWDQEYPGQAWDYTINRNRIYDYWEKRVKLNGKYDNLYTIGKRGKDDEAGSDITLEVLEEIYTDQREILKRWVNKDITKVPQVLIPYTEVLGLYNDGLKVPDDVIICWPDDNFGNIRQLPDKKEQDRSGGSGIYYHFQWLNGATTAYPWLFTTPLGLTWSEMKKAYDYNVRDLWIVNAGDIKPAEIGIEHFMQMAWDIKKFESNDPESFLTDWATRDFGVEFAGQIATILEKHFELGYARRPESMVMYDGRKQELKWDWFTISNYNDEAQKRIDEYTWLITEVDKVYKSMPYNLKDAFFQMVVYNVKGAALHNLKVLYAQKSNEYGKQGRSSAASYSALAQKAEERINELIHHYNREQVIVGDKWDRMASLPGPWGAQWHQWDMPPLSVYSGEGEPRMQLSLEGGDDTLLPGFTVFNNDRRFIDLYNSGNGAIYWRAENKHDWIILSDTAGIVYNEKRVWVSIDWEKAPKGVRIEERIGIRWRSSIDDEWRSWDNLSETDKTAYKNGTISNRESNTVLGVNLSLFNPAVPSAAEVYGFVESNGYISIEAEHFVRKTDRKDAGWRVIKGLGRSGSSVTVLPANIPYVDSEDEILRKSPLLEYDIYTFTKGEASVQLNCVPSYPINDEYGQRIAIALDNEKPQIISAENRRDVISNLMKLTGSLRVDTQGQHKLKIWMVDPGLVIDKIIIDLGGVKESYLGPPESILYRSKY